MVRISYYFCCQRAFIYLLHSKHLIEPASSFDMGWGVQNIVMESKSWLVTRLLIVLFVEMSKANSFKSQPWTHLERGNYSVFDDDFLSDKLVFKTAKKGSTSTITLKESFHTSKEGKITKSDQELKFWFPFRNTHTLYFRLKNQGYKIHYDNGVHENNGYKFNFYASVQGKRSFAGDSYKTGLEIRKDQWSTNNRVSYKALDRAVTLYNKTSFNKDKLNVGFLNAFLVFPNTWIHSAFQLGWQDNTGNDYFLRAHAGNEYNKINPINYLTHVTADYIYKFNPNNTLGVQVRANLAAPAIGNTSLIWDHKCESSANTGIKIKADIYRNVAASIKNSISGFGNYIFGINIHDLGGANRFSYGIQLDLEL